MPDVSELVTNTAFNTKIGKVEKKKTNVSGLVTNTTFNTKLVEVEKNSLPYILNTLPLMNLTSFQVEYLMKDQTKQC